MTRIFHFDLTIGYVLFFVIHILQVIRAGWNNFRAMVTGFEVVKVKDEPVVEPIVPIQEPILPPIENIPEVSETETTKPEN